MENTKCEHLARAQRFLGHKGEGLGREGESQGNSEPRHFWVNAAPLLGREHLENEHHSLFISVAPEPGLGMLLGVQQVTDE